MLTICGGSVSGNCHKVRFVADRLRIPYRRIESAFSLPDAREAPPHELDAP